MADVIETNATAPPAEAPAPEQRVAPAAIEVAAKGSVLAPTQDQATWSAAQEAGLAAIGLEKARPVELGVLLRASQAYQLDPFNRQIGMFPVWDSQLRGSAGPCT